MALSNTTADALAASICTALGVTDDVSKAKYQQVYRLVYSSLKADIAITIAALSIGTTGTAASQTGPQAPIILNPG